MTRNVTSRLFAFLLACSAIGTALPRAPGDAAPVAVAAPARVAGEVIVLLATQADGGRSVDAAIGAIPQLSKPPFNAYSQWKLVDRKTVSLERGKGTNVAVANGRTLQLTYSDLTADKRFRVSAAMMREDGSSLQKVNVVAATQEPFFLAGQKYQGGTLFIGITVKP
jgi:hypothetical protein